MNKDIENTKDIRNIGKLTFLHLIPGIVLSIVYVIISKMGILSDCPRVVTLGIATLFSIIPIELGILMYTAKKETGSLNVLEILGFKEKMKAGQFALYAIVLIIVGAFFLIVFEPVANILLDTVFSWIPEWYNFVQDMSLFDKRNIFMATLVSFFILTLIVPAVEEFYFRGFLMARMSWMGVSSVLLNVALFSIYHFYQPWMIITRFVAMLPLYYFVYKKKSLKLGIVVHAFGNFIDVVAYIMLLL